MQREGITGAAEAQLQRLLEKITPADRRAMEAAKKRWNSVAKPIGSLGVLETDIIKIAGIKGSPYGIHMEKSALAIMCADHGVVIEGVTQTGQEVTRIVAENFTKGQSSAAIMCRVSGTDVFPVDIGMLGGAPGITGFGKGDRDIASSDREPVRPFTLLNRKTACGSRNIVREAAMTREECALAILAGIELMGEFKSQGYEIAATGEMGIGNTTPSSALAAVLTGLDTDIVTGRGAGLSDQGLIKKREAVQKAVERFYKIYPQYRGHDWTADGHAEETAALLAELGGFDIAGMTGLFLGAAIYRLPAVIDGFISSVAALLAVSMCGTVREFILASHVSSEPAGGKIMEMLGLFAPLNCGMHLGEGSGAVALLPLLKMGADVYEKMSTFEDIQVESYVDYEAEKGGNP